MTILNDTLIRHVNRPPLFAKKFKSYAKNELLLCSRNTVTTSRSRISRISRIEVVTVLRDAKMCSTSERYSKNIGAQRSSIFSRLHQKENSVRVLEHIFEFH